MVRTYAMDLEKENEVLRSALRELATEVNRTLNMIVTAKSVDEIRWGATAGALTMALRLLDE